MGGMARSIAREMVAGDKEPIRDIDLICIENNNEPMPDPEVLDELSREFMPDDYAFGHGIQTEELEHYFDSRDFTVNECLILNGALVMSNYAYNDLQENIIRPTYYEVPRDDWNASGRSALRAMTMQAALLESAESYPTIEDLNINSNYIRSFDVAVQLNKAMRRGAEVACNFTNLLADYAAIPAEFGGKPKATARYLMEYRVYNFEFRESSDERVIEFGPEKNKFYNPGRASEEYHISDPVIKNSRRVR